MMEDLILGALGAVLWLVFAFILLRFVRQAINTALWLRRHRND